MVALRPRRRLGDQRASGSEKERHESEQVTGHYQSEAISSAFVKVSLHWVLEAEQVEQSLPRSH